MTSRITVISPELPPMSGGVGDYAEKLVRHWPREQDFEFIVPTHSGGAVQPLGSHKVREVGRDRAALAEQLASAGAVLLQYSAYGFDRYGYPRWLIDALIHWKKERRGRLCVMFHEIWTFRPWWNKNFAVQFLHRRALRRLLRVADAVFTSTASQADHLSSLTRGVQVAVLPVGSNIVPQDWPTKVRESGTAALFGMQATRLRALAEMVTDLRELAAAGRLTRIVTVGGGNSAEGDADERRLLDSLPLSGGVLQLGEKSATEISDILAKAEFGIAAQDPLSYTKSGTFMAYAAHGLNILSNYADTSAPEPTCLLISPAELRRNFDPVETTTRARKLRAWYERTASWPHIAREFAHVFEAPLAGDVRP